MYLIDLTQRRSFIEKIRFVYARDLLEKSIENKEDIMFAAANLSAYGVPFDRRKGNQLCPRKEDIPRLVVELEPFVDKVWKYFNEKNPNKANNQENFDEFQKTLCDDFILIMKANGWSHTYGNAQKMVNMLFKYLSCFSDYDIYADLFSYCHIPIDRQILKKLNTLFAVPNTNSAGEYVETDPSTGTNVKIPWSKIEKKSQYDRLVAAYRAILDTPEIKGSHSWLGLEYPIWVGSTIPTTGTPATVISKFYM